MQIEDNRKPSVAERVKGNPIVKMLRETKNIRIIAAIFIIAVALIIYSSVMTAKQSGAASGATAMTQEEQRLSGILSAIEGAGEVETMITYQREEIVGVLVIAEGASNLSVRLRLLDAAATALGVSRQLVNVYSHK